MKDKIIGALGVVGFVLWYILSIIFGFCPLFFLRLPHIFDWILMAVIIFIPFWGEGVRLILYIWAFFVVLVQPKDIFSIIFFIFFAIYIFAFGIPFIKTALSFFNRKDNEEY